MKQKQYIRIGKLKGLLVIGTFAASCYGLLTYSATEDFLGYFIVLLAAITPIYLWLRMGAPGIPAWPVCAMLYFFYYGLPALRGVAEVASYTPSDVLRASGTVLLFLISATVTWAFWLTSTNRRPPVSHTVAAFHDRQVVALTLFGFGLGLAYYVVLYSGLLNGAASYSGVVRAVLQAPSVLSCFLFGHARAKNLLSLKQRAIVISMFIVYLAFEVIGGQLITPAISCAAAFAGYIFTSNRIPWGTLAFGIALLTIFQAGKVEARSALASRSVGIVETPAMLLEWLGDGVDSITAGESTSSVADRASLLNQLIRVEQWTPSLVPYLYGETYMQLPAMLVPRFIEPDRAPTQGVMNMLDVRYGFLNAEDTRHTAVGINLIPEAFANCGYLGVVLIGVFVGGLTGLATTISKERNPTSLPYLFAIIVMVTWLNLEADLSYMLSALFQSTISIFAFYFVFKHLPIRKHQLLTPPLHAARSGGHQGI